MGWSATGRRGSAERFEGGRVVFCFFFDTTFAWPFFFGAALVLGTGPVGRPVVGEGGRMGGRLARTGFFFFEAAVEAFFFFAAGMDGEEVGVDFRAFEAFDLAGAFGLVVAVAVAARGVEVDEGTTEEALEMVRDGDRL